MAAVTCPCGTRFEAASSRAVYCSPRCRKRGSRAGLVAATPAAPAPPNVATARPQPDAAEVPSICGAVIAELAKAKALNTPLGLTAVQLARLIDSATPLMGSSVAAWSRELRACLAEASQAAPDQEVDPLDELERKRAGRRGA